MREQTLQGRQLSPCEDAFVGDIQPDDVGGVTVRVLEDKVCGLGVPKDVGLSCWINVSAHLQTGQRAV